MYEINNAMKLKMACFVDLVIAISAYRIVRGVTGRDFSHIILQYEENIYHVFGKMSLACLESMASFKP